MFDCHQAEITVMQFTGHSLPVHQSTSVPWVFYLVPFFQRSPPTRFLLITAIGMCHFLPVHHFGMACLAGSMVNIQQMVKGSVNFLFLPDRRCSMAACGGSISNVSYNVSVASSSSWGVRPGSSSLRLLISFRCLLCLAVGPRMMYVVFPILLSIVPSSKKKMCCYCRL